MSTLSIIDFYAKNEGRFAQVAGPGGFNDPDEVNWGLGCHLKYCIAAAVIVVTIMLLGFWFFFGMVECFQGMGFRISSCTVLNVSAPFRRKLPYNNMLTVFIGCCFKKIRCQFPHSMSCYMKLNFIMFKISQNKNI